MEGYQKKVGRPPSVCHIGIRMHYTNTYTMQASISKYFAVRWLYPFFRWIALGIFLVLSRNIKPRLPRTSTSERWYLSTQPSSAGPFFQQSFFTRKQHHPVTLSLLNPDNENFNIETRQASWTSRDVMPPAWIVKANISKSTHTNRGMHCH